MARRSKKASRQPATPPLHELEAEVMEEIWTQREATMPTVMGALTRRTSETRASTAYMTIMARLHRKGVLDRRREGKTDFYAPKLDRAEFMGCRAAAEVGD